MIIRRLSNNKFETLKDINLKPLYDCIQELQLWKGENPMDVEAGVDYFSIFNNRTFIELELRRVIDKHKIAYSHYEILNINFKDEILTANIIFYVDDVRVFNFELNINKGV